MKMSVLEWIALVLVIVGALNWGLVGLLDFNLVTAIFGDASTMTKVVYDLVGISGVYMIISAATKKSA